MCYDLLIHCLFSAVLMLASQVFFTGHMVPVAIGIAMQNIIALCVKIIFMARFMQQICIWKLHFQNNSFPTVV